MDTAVSTEGAAPAGGQSTPAGAFNQAPAPLDAEKAAKRKAAAESRKQARAEEKARREARRLKALAKKAAEPPPASLAPAQTTSPGDQLATRPGWPTDAQQAAAMPAAVMILTQVRTGLGATRYGVALEAREEVIGGPDGQPRKVYVDPIGQQLAPPLAAMLAGAGGGPTPGQAFLIAAGFVLVPVAVGHAIEGVIKAIAAARERREQRERAEVRATAPAPKPPPEPKPPRESSATLKLANGEVPKA